MINRKVDKLTIDLCPCDNKEEMSKFPFASIIDSLIYVVVCTQPNISHSMGVVRRFLANPNKQHQQVVKWILMHLKGISHYCLCFGNNNAMAEGYTNANIIEYVDIRMSTTSYLYTFVSATMS